MKVLVVNCGSSSLKYQIIDMANENVLAKGLVERIGIEGSVLKHEKEGADKVEIQSPMKDHKDAIGMVLEVLVDEKNGVIADMGEISAVGHRVVHAGEKYSGSVLINEDVLDALEECIELAPLHNPPNIMGIKACQELMPETPMVGVFDTAFHQTMPPVSYLYSIPYEYYEKYKVRRYGFHGTSHRYVAERAAAMLGKDLNSVKLVSCHLGNGSSISAIDNGKSIDTTMGFTPLEGLTMGTRCGDLDPAIIKFIMEKEGLDASGTDTILQKKSGVLGISGVSSDFRDIEDSAAKGDERAKLALDIFAMKVKKYIGAYLAELNGADAIIFTAGVGENAIDMRKKICKDLDALGIIMDEEKNNIRGKETVVSADDSKIKILVIPTDEELMIAKDTVEIVKG